MSFNPRVHHRRSIRLRNRSYTEPGFYFVTLCIVGKTCMLGDVSNGQMMPNAAGKIVADSWRWLGTNFPTVVLDEWIVMPNHLHGVLQLREVGSQSGGGSRSAPTFPVGEDAVVVKPKPLGQIVAAFKTVSSRKVNASQGVEHHPVWQRNYFERVVRSSNELARIRAYIRANAENWAQDEENPTYQPPLLPTPPVELMLGRIAIRPRVGTLLPMFQSQTHDPPPRWGTALPIVQSRIAIRPLERPRSGDLGSLPSRWAIGYAAFCCRPPNHSISALSTRRGASVGSMWPDTGSSS